MYKQITLKLPSQVIIVQNTTKVIVMPLLRKNNFSHLLKRACTLIISKLRRHNYCPRAYLIR